MRDSGRAVNMPFWDDVDDSEALRSYRTLVDAVDDGIYQLDSDGRFVGVNEKIVA